MPLNFLFFLLFSFASLVAQSQNADSSILNIGDQAPALRVHEWLKGKPIDSFEKGKIYVVEFWATWCGPCRAEMPNLSKLARKYRKRITVIGIDINGHTVEPVEKIKAFVDSMGVQMDFAIALDDNSFMESKWFNAANEYYIPTTFIVNAQGKIAWVGNPQQLHEVLPKIIKDDWDINEKSAKRGLKKYLEKLDDSLSHELDRFSLSNSRISYYLSDSSLLAIDEIIKKSPD